MTPQDLKKYRKVQQLCKDTFANLDAFLKQGMSEVDVANECDRFLKEKGITSTWYHGVLTMAFVGENTTTSISGKNYKPNPQFKIKSTDLVAVDLAPEINGYWGDCARSFVIENGKITKTPSKTTQELFEGIEIENKLHEKLIKIAHPEMTFEELDIKMLEFIKNLGYKNLDFLGNLGHSIEKDIDARIYIKKNEKRKLNQANLFTFEPHIKKLPNGAFGFRREDIYYFNNKKLTLL